MSNAPLFQMDMHFTLDCSLWRGVDLYLLTSHLSCKGSGGTRNSFKNEIGRSMASQRRSV